MGEELLLTSPRPPGLPSQSLHRSIHRHPACTVSGDFPVSHWLSPHPARDSAVPTGAAATSCHGHCSLHSTSPVHPPQSWPSVGPRNLSKGQVQQKPCRGAEDTAPRWPVAVHPGERDLHSLGLPKSPEQYEGAIDPIGQQQCLLAIHFFFPLFIYFFGECSEIVGPHWAAQMTLNSQHAELWPSSLCCGLPEAELCVHHARLWVPCPAPASPGPTVCSRGRFGEP